MATCFDQLMGQKLDLATSYLRSWGFVPPGEKSSYAALREEWPHLDISATLSEMSNTQMSH